MGGMKAAAYCRKGQAKKENSIKTAIVGGLSEVAFETNTHNQKEEYCREGFKK